MYKNYFDFEEEPFAITPDPRFLYLSPRHREAIAHLLYGMGRGGGFVQLTGEVGTGKTTLCRSLLEQTPKGVDTALILNPRQTASELLASVCDELSIEYPKGTESVKALVDALNGYLLEAHARGRRTVLIIDEAQNLSTDVLEQIRLLTNLETSTEKLLQIILIGQPELQEMLALPEMRQLAQRTTAYFHLMPLSADEAQEYIHHRLRVAGSRDELFDRRLSRLVHRLSGGIPRLINVICDRALLGAYAEQRKHLSRKIIRKAAAEVIRNRSRRHWHPALVGVATSVLVVSVAAVWLLLGTPLLSISAKSQGDSELRTVEPRVKPDASSTAPAVNHEQDGVLHGLLRANELVTHRSGAFRTLFELWNLPFSDDDRRTACDQADRAGLRCLHGDSTLERLHHYNRPAVIVLTDDSTGENHLAVLAALHKSQATLNFAGRTVSVSHNELEKVWSGEFIVLWNAPPLEARVLKEGIAGSGVLWLRNQLRLAEGLSPQAGPVSERFDEALRAKVMEFQRRADLHADGVVGARTLLQLDAAAGSLEGPRLH
jgi:general secretion pathway protein A